MDERTHQVEKIELDSFSVWKLNSTHTFKLDYFLKAGVDNIFDFTDTSSGYNSGNPGRTFYVGFGLNL